MSIMEWRAKRLVQAWQRRVRRRAREEYAEDQRKKPAEWQPEDERWLDLRVAEYKELNDTEQEVMLKRFKIRANMMRSNPEDIGYIGYCEDRIQPIVYAAVKQHRRVQGCCCTLMIISGLFAIVDAPVIIVMHFLGPIPQRIAIVSAVIALALCVMCGLAIHHDRVRWRWLAKAKRRQERYNRLYEAAFQMRNHD